MWKVGVAIVAVWLLLSVMLAKGCNELGKAMDACRPGIVTTQKDGNTASTFACTAPGKVSEAAQ